jgi:hypothetical protein
MRFVRYGTLLFLSLLAATGFHVFAVLAACLLIFFTFGKVSDAVWLLGIFYVPYLVAGVVLARVKRFALPLIVVPAGAIIGWYALGCFHNMYYWEDMAIAAVPSIILSCVGCWCSFALRARLPTTEPAKPPNTY